MAKVHGYIGYGHAVEDPPGIVKDVITEKPIRGDKVRSSRQLIDGEKINDDLTINTSISVVADAYANENMFAIRYFKLAGAYWKVVDVDDSTRPRLLLRLGGVYNGQRAPVTESTVEPDGDGGGA